MLGHKEYIGPLSREESKIIRATAYRMATGSLNDEDRKLIAHYNKLSALNRDRVVWK